MLILVFNRNSNGTNKNFHSVIIYCLLQFQGERMWARDRLWMCMLFFFFFFFFFSIHYNGRRNSKIHELMFTFCSIHYKDRRNTKYVKSCLQGIFLPSSTFRGDSFCVPTAPTSNHMQSTCTLQIPNTGSRTIVRAYKNTAHTDRNG